MFILLLSLINTISSFETIYYASQHSLIGLKSYYSPTLELYCFKINNEFGKIILQPFKDIDYLFLCSQEKQLTDIQNNCVTIYNLKANHDNDLTEYAGGYKLLIFLFHEELQLKVFLDESITTINLSADINNKFPFYKCTDFFDGYDKISFEINNFVNNNHSLNIQYTSNISAILGTKINIINRITKKELLNLESDSNNTLFILEPNNRYSLFYSPPFEENIHSMLCLTFNDLEEYYIGNTTKEIPIISPGYFKFYTFLEEAWNISSLYYPTTFYFYLKTTKYTNCSAFQIFNETKNYLNCALEKVDNEEGLYYVKLYSYSEAYIYLTIYFEPDLIDEDCHFGKIISFNKSVDEYDAKIHYDEVLSDVIDYLAIIMAIYLVIVLCFSFFPLCRKKCNSLNDNIENK